MTILQAQKEYLSLPSSGARIEMIHIPGDPCKLLVAPFIGSED